MNTLAICALFGLVTMSFGFHLDERRKRSDAEYFVSYVSSSSGNGQQRMAPTKESQTITIHDKEVRFIIDGDMSVVLDFNKMLMTIKDLPGVKFCGALKFDEELVPVTFQQIKDALNTGNKEFTLPTKKISLNLQKVEKAAPPELSPLSAELCPGEVYLLEPKPKVDNTVKALALHRRLRPKREVGWGEIVVIVIVIIILL